VRAALRLLAVLPLVVVVLLREPPAPVPSPRLHRLLGPVAGLARDVQWIRFQRALLAGEEERAIALAESAIAFDPGATEGWVLLASHLAFFRASLEREDDVERRRAWFRAGVEVTRRGAEVARDPGELHLWRGLLFLDKAEMDPALDARGAPGLLAQAVLALEDADAAGHPDAPGLLAQVRALAAE
jgi:hypothetical protein